MTNPYDALAPVYDRWITGDPCCTATLRFYLDWLAGKTGRIVEGGVGTGRIAIELARRGQRVIGIDISERMLTIATERARAFGVEAMLSLRQMDLQQITLTDVDIFILPFRTIGHFTRVAERQRVFEQVFHSLAPGGRFVFDHYVADINWAKSTDGQPQQMFGGGGVDSIEIYDTYRFDLERGLMHCDVEIRAGDLRAPRRNVAFDFAWVAPDEVRSMAKATGFRVEAVYGDFEAGPFGAESEQQIWILRRPYSAGE